MDDPVPRLRINALGRTVCSPDWVWDTNPGLKDCDLLTFLGGRGWYRVGEDLYEVSAGHVLLLREGTCCTASMDSSDPMTVIFAHFDYLPSSVAVLPTQHTMLRQPEFYFSLLDKMLSAGKEQLRLAQHWLSGALVELCRQHAEPRWSGPEAEQVSKVQSLCAAILNSPEKRWPLSLLAKKLHCSPGHLTRLFRKYTDTTPQEFIVRSRIKAAQAMLLESSLPIGTISELLGFTDVHAFSRQFKKKAGTPPGAFRKGRLIEIAPQSGVHPQVQH